MAALRWAFVAFLVTLSFGVCFSHTPPVIVTEDPDVNHENFPSFAALAPNSANYGDMSIENFNVQGDGIIKQDEIDAGGPIVPSLDRAENNNVDFTFNDVNKDPNKPVYQIFDAMPPMFV